MGEKLIITAALCGAGTTKAQTPYVPITPEEIAADAVACAKAGAAVIHIHVRDENGVNSMDTKRFYQVVNLVREECGKAGVDPVLNLTTSGSKWPEDIRRAHLPILKPEMCSYDPGTMNWANSYVFTNTPTFLEQLGYEVQELGIKPECEIFDGGMMGNVDYYVKKGVLKEPSTTNSCWAWQEACEEMLILWLSCYLKCGLAPPGPLLASAETICPVCSSVWPRAVTASGWAWRTTF